MSTPSDRQLTSAAAIWLVTRREVHVRFRSKAFLISTAVMLAAVLAMVVLTQVIGGLAQRTTVGFTEQAAPLAAPFRAAAQATDQEVATHPVSDPGKARERVRAGELDVLVTGKPKAPRLVVRESIGSDLRAAFDTAARRYALDRQIVKLGGDPAEVGRTVAAAEVDVRPLAPEGAHHGERLLLGIIAATLIYFSVLMLGANVAQGVIEEKASRIVELLLTAIRPWHLMAGKVLGIALVGLAQMAATAAVGLGAAMAAGALEIPASVTSGMAAWTLVWYLIGFFTYALMFAAGGALVSRQEDSGAVVMPLMMLIIVPYVLGITIIPNDPDSTLIQVLSMIPVCSPTLMPMRIALGAPGWQVAVAVAASLVALALLVRLTGTVYANAVLRTGSRVNLRDAFRAA